MTGQLIWVSIAAFT